LYSYGDERIGHGRETAKTFLRENPQRALEIEDKIRAAHGLDFGMTETDSPLMED
jgi:recombination protein RecA